jgi:hypothetical protein
MVGVMAGTAAAARQPSGQALRSVMVVLAFTVVPLLALMIHQVRRGAWENADASNRSDRPILFFAGIVTLLALLAYVIIVGRESFIVRGVLATFAMLAVCAAATISIKVSLHMAFGALAATALALMGSAVGYILLILLPALAWARLVLSRHTRLEVALGTMIGAAAGAGIHYF